MQAKAIISSGSVVITAVVDIAKHMIAVKFIAVHAVSFGETGQVLTSLTITLLSHRALHQR